MKVKLYAEATLESLEIELITNRRNHDFERYLVFLLTVSVISKIV